MSIESTIDEIVEKGTQVNERLDQKIKALEQHNNTFRETLLNKLRMISAAIDNFRRTNLEGLTETKNDLDVTRRQLQESQEELTRTQAELENVKNQLTDINNRLTATNEEKRNLDLRIAQFEQIIREMETKCANDINAARQEMADKRTQGLKEMEQIQREIQQESDARIAELNKNIEELRRQSDDAQRGQENANNELRTLQENQERLLVKLGTVNEVLANQLRMIDESIDLNNPNYGEYSDLLDAIQAGLGSVMGGINSAVSGAPSLRPPSSGPPSLRPPSSGPPSSGAPSGPSYDAEKNYTELVAWFKKYGKGDMKLFFTYIRNYGQIKGYTIPDKDYNELSQVAVAAKKPEIIKILKKYSMIIAENPPRTGGKRKTMKKRPRKTRKHMKKYQKGGYTYNTNKNLDKESSVISNSSSNGKSRRNRRSRHRSRK